MNPQRVVLPCKCVVMLDHDRGQRRVVCEGHSDERRGWEGCRGGRGYVVTAETVEMVVYDVRPLAVREEVA